MSYRIAGIDVHKKVLMVVVTDASVQEQEFERRRFGTLACDLERLAEWLKAQEVREVVMESTAQYWKPVWLTLEPHFRLHLAQAHSNRAPKGRKSDFRDAERLARRYIAAELILSFVPEPEQREMRLLTRRRVQLTRDRARVQSQMECLLEEGRIKLSSVVSDLLGASARRILRALAKGESNPATLATLGDERLKCTEEQLQQALRGSLSPVQRALLAMYLQSVELVDQQLRELDELTAKTMKAHREVILRLVDVPGIRVIAAQQIVAEAGPQAATFPSASQFSSWMGASPGHEESAEKNASARCPKGNKYLRRVLCQCAQAAIKTKNSWFQALFRRLLPRLGYNKALWAVVRHLSRVVWKILHDAVRYEERGGATTPEAAKRRAQRMVHQLRQLGYIVEIKPAAASVPA